MIHLWRIPIIQDVTPGIRGDFFKVWLNVLVLVRGRFHQKWPNLLTTDGENSIVVGGEKQTRFFDCPNRGFRLIPHPIAVRPVRGAVNEQRQQNYDTGEYNETFHASFNPGHGCLFRGGLTFCVCKPLRSIKGTISAVYTRSSESFWLSGLGYGDL